MLISRFLADRRGGVMPMFGLAAVALIGIAGAAVDYSRGNAARTELQAALDAAALMLSKDIKADPTIDPTPKARDYFLAQFSMPWAQNVQVSASKTGPINGRYTLNVSASASVATTLTRVIGQTQMNIGSSSQVVWGKKLEIALVLDNTGSMGQSGKIAALRTAAHNFMTKMQNASNQPGMQPGDVKVAIIPFDTRVNIGTGFKNTGWINYTLKSVNINQWTGCVIDRNQPNDTLDTTPVSGNTATYFPADTNCTSGSATLAQALPLTYDWTALNSKVDQMNPVGSTDVTIGLVWGWHALTSNDPFTQAAAPNANLDKVIIMLTDGENTQSRYASCSNGCSAIDNRTSAVCTNIKAAGIFIYTVRVIDGNATLLQNCASQAGMYYSVSQASQLDSVFDTIAQELLVLRLAQ